MNLVDAEHGRRFALEGGEGWGEVHSELCTSGGVQHKVG